MADDEEEDAPHGLAQRLRERLSIIIGVVGLFAWFAMLWFMFGDVL